MIINFLIIIQEITMNKNQVEKVIWWALKNLLGNLLPFIPFGFLLPIAYP